MDTKLNNNTTELNTKILRILTGNIKSNWKDRDKNLKIRNCPLCLKKWLKPLRHIMKECEVIQDKFSEYEIDKNDKQILSIEYMKIILEIIISADLDIEI